MQSSIHITYDGHSWPEGISDGLTLPCCLCQKHTAFDYTIDDACWDRVIADRFRRNVVCLDCFDRLATEQGIDVSQHLLRIQFTGLGKTIVLVPSQVFHYGVSSPLPTTHGKAASQRHGRV